MDDIKLAKKMRRELDDEPVLHYVGRLAPSPTGMMHIGHAQTFYVAMQRAVAHQNVYEKQNKLIQNGVPICGPRLSPARLIFRVEDLDIGRCKEHYLVDIIQDLTWFGISWDEGPGSRFEQLDGLLWDMSRCKESVSRVGNDKPPVTRSLESFYQSRRGMIYEAALDLLSKYGYVYACKYSRRQIEAELRRQNPAHIETSPSDVGPQSAPNEGDYDPIFPVALRPSDLTSPRGVAVHDDADVASEKESSKVVSTNWRFRVPDDGKPVCFEDSRCGSCAFTPLVHFGDFLVFSKQGYAAYEMAVVIDDALMGVTEVVRGEDLLVSTARQILLRRALRDCCRQERLAGREPAIFSAALIEAEPRYFHCPLMRDSEGKRMSKRRGSETLRSLRERGMTPEQIVGEFFEKAL